MLGLMMDVPLLVTSILDHAATAHGSIDIVARTIDGRVHRHSYATASQRCKCLAQALRTLGLSPSDRVGSLAWNTHHHFELFYGVTGLGVVLHTINPRLHDDTLAMMINHADDRWIFIDEATLPLAERIAARLPTVAGWILMSESGDVPETSLPNVVSYEHLLAAQADGFDWPQFDERAGYSAAAMARSFFYDTVLYDPAALRFLSEAVGEDRLLVGSDYPFTIKQDRPGEFAAQALGLGPEVFATNALRFLNRRSVSEPWGGARHGQV